MKQRGFTLIEIMMVTAILAILAAFAMASYQNSVQKSRRAEAKTALMGAINDFEVYYGRRNQYPGALSDIYSADTVDTETGLYELSILDTDGDGDTQEFELQAEPKAGGRQADDPCGTFIINHLGAKDVDNTTGKTAEDCW